MSHEPHAGMSPHATNRNAVEGSIDAFVAGNEDLRATCIQRTASALMESGGASHEEIELATQQCEEADSRGKRFDLLEVVARVQGHEEDVMGGAVFQLSECVAGTLATPPALVTFAAKLISTNAFYVSFPELHKACRELLCPVVYAEDSDAIGTASINPIAATMIAGLIENTVSQHLGIKPFVTAARMDYESWCFLTRKHFEP